VRWTVEWIHRRADAARRVTHPAAAEVHLYLEDGLLKADGIMRMQVASTLWPSLPWSRPIHFEECKLIHDLFPRFF
jgi:hypothetical protein